MVVLLLLCCVVLLLLFSWQSIVYKSALIFGGTLEFVHVP